MSKFILGSGINGLLARAILGPEWELIPFGKSRFYSFQPPLADNHIVFHKDVHEAISNILRLNNSITTFFRATSYSGQLIFSDESFAKKLYINKLFGDNPHPASDLLLRHELNVYKNISVTGLYSELHRQHQQEIKDGILKYGNMVSLNANQRYITTTNGNYAYEQIISTIPLDALQSYNNTPTTLPAIDVWYYEVHTPSLNLEGAKQVLVADAPFDFFKVDNHGNNQYVFHCHRDLGNPETYLGAFLNNNLVINNFTRTNKAYPIGAPPSLLSLEQDGIYPVGCHAQWDYFMDVSSSIRRLMKLKNG